MILLIKVAMSSFRSLAPSHQHDQPSGSSPTKQGAFVGESSTSGGTSGGASGSGGDSHRRRRNAGNVSLMACNECRHARQKVRSFILPASCRFPYSSVCRCFDLCKVKSNQNPILYAAVWRHEARSLRKVSSTKALLCLRTSYQNSQGRPHSRDWESSRWQWKP